MFSELVLTPILLLGSALLLPSIIIRGVSEAPRRKIVAMCQDVDKVMEWLKSVLEIDRRDQVFFVPGGAVIDTVKACEPDMVVVSIAEQVEQVNEELDNVPCLLIKT